MTAATSLSIILLLWIIGAITSHPMTNNENGDNFNCPKFCHCNPSKSHNEYLHANCTSVNGLRSDYILKSTLPIHSIDLSHIGLTRVPEAINKLPNLTSINLAHNGLQDIGHLSDGIKRLHLQYNKIKSTGISNLPKNLQFLNLQFNEITFLPFELTQLEDLLQLELSHNRINCSCGTLNVRNWLQEHHVFMENAVFCSAPEDAKGKPWLQVSHWEICDKEKPTEPAEQFKDAMLGDQPFGDASNANEAVVHEDQDDLGEAFIPITNKQSAQKMRRGYRAIQDGGAVEAVSVVPSLASNEHSNKLHTVMDEPLETEEEDGFMGSGSGDDEIIISLPHVSQERLINDELEPTPSIELKDVTFKELFLRGSAPEPPTADVFEQNHMGIFEANVEEEPPAVDKTNSSALVEAPGLASDGTPTTTTTTTPPLVDSNAANSNDILTAEIAKNGDSNATYFLLAVIGLIVIGLILFVCIKRAKKQNRAGKDNGTKYPCEMQYMDKKKKLGKPLEQLPLVGDKMKLEKDRTANGGKKLYDPKHENDDNSALPLVHNGNGVANGKISNENELDGNNENEAGGVCEATMPQHEYHPITPRYPTPQSPRASKYAQSEQNNNDLDQTSSPNATLLSPRRYSPVYSPETGRVKIKLCETPKPKTPKILNRTCNNVTDTLTRTDTTKDNTAATAAAAAVSQSPPVVMINGQIGQIDS